MGDAANVINDPAYAAAADFVSVNFAKRRDRLGDSRA